MRLSPVLLTVLDVYNIVRFLVSFFVVPSKVVSEFHTLDRIWIKIDKETFQIASSIPIHNWITDIYLQIFSPNSI